MRNNAPVSKLTKEKVLETTKLCLSLLVYRVGALDITEKMTWA